MSFHTYARPIPTPVRTLSPARDTCEQCHWPEKFHGDCHHRPSHGIAATPERAVNERLARGSHPKTLPFVRREAVKALKANYSSEDELFVGCLADMPA